jgi:hypothetical protein
MKGAWCSESTKLTSYAITMDEKESSPLLMKKKNWKLCNVLKLQPTM